MLLPLQHPQHSDAGRADPQVVVRAALRSPTHSHENRRIARDVVWSWVGSRWPHLVPPRAQLESGQLQCLLPGRSLNVCTTEDGATWSLQVSYSDRNGACTWTTRTVVSDLGDADGLAVQTSYAARQGQRSIAPPRVLGRWAKRLQLDDAGIAVQDEPRAVEDEHQLSALIEHLQSDRMLPVIVLGNRRNSRYYGVDPRGLAEAVCGLAHVAFLTPEAIAAFAARFGRGLAPAPGAVRIYMPGFHAAVESRQHPLLRPAHHAGAQQHPEPDAGAFRRFVCRRVCELSVLATRDAFAAA